MKFLLEDWLKQHRKDVAKKRSEINREKFKKAQETREENFTEKCERLFPKIKSLNDRGYLASEIAAIIGVDKTHIYHIFRKLNVEYNKSPMGRSCYYEHTN